MFITHIFKLSVNIKAFDKCLEDRKLYSENKASKRVSCVRIFIAL